MPPGRPPSVQPALAYTYRRPILIVQILATIESNEWIPALVQLCAAWGVDPVLEYKTNRVNFAATLKLLSAAALDEARNEEAQS